VIYAFVVGMGLDVTPEDVTNYGRIDFTIKALEKIFIFEFKVIDEDDTDVSALQQIKDKNYAEKYQASSDMIYLIGVHFSKEQRNVVGFEWEKFPQ
jgi:RNase H-fold protein (predicted Holliday junction resolvase)